MVLLTSSCGKSNKQSKSEKSEVPPDKNLSFDNAANDSSEWKSLNWEKYQDSLRDLIIARKDNKILANSFLQEMYVRNAVTILGDSLSIVIPFDLHGPDCIAPDCYSTDISFKLKWGDTLQFPEKMKFMEYEHGCVQKETKLSGIFESMEQTPQHVIYHSENLRRTLVLFPSNKKVGTTAYYFVNVERNRINGNNVYDFVNLDKKRKYNLYPFTSWKLTTGEYENFIE